MEDINLICQDCNQEFIYTQRDQQFVMEQKFTPFKRCKDCRYKKRMKKREQSQG